MDAFTNYLHMLPKDSGYFGCDPEEHCKDGNGPPCPEWDRAHPEAYLQKLQQRLASL